MLLFKLKFTFFLIFYLIESTVADGNREVLLLPRQQYTIVHNKAWITLQLGWKNALCRCGQ